MSVKKALFSSILQVLLSFSFSCKRKHSLYKSVKIALFRLVDGLGLVILARFSLFTHRIGYLGAKQQFSEKSKIDGAHLGEERDSVNRRVT